jgi:hypothetical protein
MLKTFVSILFVIVIVSMFSACAVVPPPMHTPSDSASYNRYEIKKDILNLQPYPDGTPRYSFRVPIGGGETATGYLFVQTNADTKGLDLMKDGSLKFVVTVLRYTREGGSGFAYLIGSIESENQRKAINLKIAEEEQKKSDEKRKEIQGMEATFRSDACGEAMRWNYYCFDDNNKLNGHDIKAISKLLTDVTYNIVKGSNYLSSHRYKPTQVGEWYIESASKDSVNITITHGSRNDIIGETVIDRKARAGSYYYFIRNLNQTSSN